MEGHPVWSVWIEEGRLRSRLHVGRPSRRPLALPGERWVRVRNYLAGIDEQDLALARGELRGAARLALPRMRRRYLGREVVGTVTETGPEVTLVREGDRVVLQSEAVSTCATLGLHPPCQACAAWNVSLCEHRTLPYPGTGAGWSDEMIVHESQLFPVPSALSDDQAVLLEPAARATRAVLQRSPEPGTEVLVIGGGAMGQLVIAALHAAAPGPHITLASDAHYQTEAAKKQGVTSIISGNYRDMLLRGAELANAQIMRRGGQIYVHGGYDVVFDCRGADQSVDAALQLVRSGGTVVLVAGATRPMQLDISPLWREEVTVVGIAGPGSESLPEDMVESVGARLSSLALAGRLMLKQRLNTGTIITHREPARQIRQVLRLAAEPLRNHVIRAVITFDAEGAS
jgi:threonine dehydrogenase-like Zn-dependent dehydrogenase